MSDNRDRLFELLPSIYRRRDAEAGWPLRALLQIITDQVNAVEGDITQLYQNWFIETCQDWVIPYIGDLIGYKLVHQAGEPEDPTGNRALQLNKILIPRREVANTIRFRRRKGTLALLEVLSNMAAGWPARAVQFYRLLCWTQAINHLRPTQGRTTDLRQGDALQRLNGPFDEIAHNVDIHRINSKHAQGRYNINDVGLFVWRLKPYQVTKTAAYCREEVGHNCYTFSVLGNDTPLYTLPEPEKTPTHVAGELNLPTPIRRRAFEERIITEGKERRRASADYYGINKSVLIWAEGWAGTSQNDPIPRKAIIPADLRHWQYTPPLDHVAVDPELGRITFPSRQLPHKVSVSYQYAFSDDLGGGEYDRALRTDESTIYYVGEGKEQTLLNKALERWQSDKPSHAIIEITDNSVFTEQIYVKLGKNQTLQIRASNRKRPIIRLLDWHTDLPDDLTIEGTDGGCFALDGLLITGRGVQTRGKMDHLIIRHSTLVPSWTRWHDLRPRQPTRASVELLGSCMNVNLEHSIVGSIQVMHDEVHEDPVKITVSDSIIDATNLDREAVGARGYRLAHALLTFLRSTILGQIQVHAINLAENCIFNGAIEVARRQMGCMRFCYVPPGSRTPRRYNCQPDLAEKTVRDSYGSLEVPFAIENARLRVRPQFNSVEYGTPTYCQLAESCAEEIVRGADDRSEMGVFHDLYQPQRAAILKARLEEYSQAYMDANTNYAN